MAEQTERGRADTRAAIVAAGLQGFGAKGFEATTTREIAALAGTNVASISYHFGGKEGLRAACAEHVVGVVRGVVGTAVAAADTEPSAEAARLALNELVERMVHFIVLRPESRLIAGFIVREMGQPSRAFDIIYDGLFEGVHRRVCALWSAATGQEAESEAVKLAVFASIGQIVYFHIGRPLVERRLAWEGIGVSEARAIAAAVTRSLNARLDADAGGAG
jgi:TetR/AcrR family transcriptional regulator, regulator of cefoperazone and chloramphenicol sensitivity